MRNVLKSVLFVMSLILSVGSHTDAQSDIKLELGAKLPRRYIDDDVKYLVTAGAQTRPFVEITVSGVRYMIAFEEKSRRIKYIYTTDANFRSANGFKIGDEITVLYKDLNILGYFQIRAPADRKGWQPVIGFAEAFERHYLEDLEKAGRVTRTIGGFAKGSN